MVVVKRGRFRTQMMAATAAMVLVGATACSRDDDDDPVGADGETSTSAAVDADAALAAGEFGDLEAVCGPAPEGETLTATDSQGVTADAIQIGTIADVDNPVRPGLGQNLWDASNVFVDWCNSLGGINGRQIEMIERDSGFFNYQATIAEACLSDFALVGGASTNDGVGQEDRVGCLLIDLPAFHGTGAARSSDLAFRPQPLPPDALPFGIGRYIDETYPGSGDNVGILTGNGEQTVAVAQQFKEAGEALGWSVVYEDQYSLTGEQSYAAYAQRIASSGVTGLMLLAEPVTAALVLQELANIGYQLEWVVGGPQFYDPEMIEVAAASLAATPVLAGVQIVPFEKLEDSVALQQYFSLFDQYLPDGLSDKATSVASFSAWLLWATAADACGVDLTRRCLYDELAKITEWDGGGLATPTNPSAGTPSECNAAVQATVDGFVILEFEPNLDFFNCDPANVFSTTPLGGVGATLEGLGLSLDDL